MIRIKIKAAVLAVAIASAFPVAQAQIPTTDVANIGARAVQFGQQMESMVSQLNELKAQLDQAKMQYAASTGSRGMGSMLNGLDYNRVPTNWQDTLDMMNGGNGRYGNISASANNILRSMNGIDPSVFDEVDGAYGQLSGSAANQSASYQALQGEQYNNTSARFADLKQLITKIDQAPDEKAISDLNARIGAEQVMLQNEQLKMQALAQIHESQKELQQAKLQQAWIQNSNSHAPDLGAPVTTLGEQ